MVYMTGSQVFWLGVSGDVMPKHHETASDDAQNAWELAFGRLCGTLEGVTATRRCFGIASATLPTQRSAKTII